MSSKEQLVSALKQHRLSLTKPRLLVFDALSGQDPKTIQQIASLCGDGADRATIYRVIALFEKIGVIHRVQIGWKHKYELSDSFHAHHHHLTCINCGRVSTLPEDTKLEERLTSLTGAQNFIMRNHQLEIQGVCNDCTN